MSRPEPTPQIAVNDIMADLQRRVRVELRARLLDKGAAPEFSDQDIFDEVERIFREAFESLDRGTLLIPNILLDEEEWRLETSLRLSSHRTLLGAPILFVKRRVLLPLTRWLFEYSQHNFRRQQRLNDVMFACLQALAVENAHLRRDLKALRAGRAGGAAMEADSARS